MNSSNYETLYGVGLLDDLHNYFPALLYDSSSFSSVGQALTYIQQQTRNRFDLFSYGQREYVASHPRQTPVETSLRQTFRAPFGMTPLSTQLASNLQTSPPPPSQPPGPSARRPQAVHELFTINLPLPGEDGDDEGEEEVPASVNQAAQALVSLLTMPNTLTNRPLLRGNLMGGSLLDAFLQPVVVRPTAEQISQHTTVGNLVSDTEHTCAICQETIQAEQEARKLNACAHWFHRSCIDTWFQRDVHCPVCRHDIRQATVAPSRRASQVSGSEQEQ